VPLPRAVVGLLSAVIGAAILTAAAAGAQGPRNEKLALTPAGTALAKAASAQRSDLGAGWSGGAVPATSDPPDCPWQDYSAFTLQGRADAQFLHGDSALLSEIAVFPDAGQAQGDIAVNAKPGTAACEGKAIAKSISPSAKVLVAKRVAAPAVGQRAVEYAFAIKGSPATLNARVLFFTEGRVQARIGTISVAGSSVPPIAKVAQAIDRRIRRS
jgi:hypothetical protein